MRESRTYGSVRGACDETHVPTATQTPRVHHAARRRGGAWPLAARAQQSAVPVVGFVSISDRKMTLQAPWYQAFFQRLRDLGWAPGRNITIEYCFADNRPNQLPALLKDLKMPSMCRRGLLFNGKAAH